MAATAVRAKVVLSGCGCLLFLLLVFLEDGSTGAGHGLGAFELQAPPHIFLVIIYTNIENHIIPCPIIPSPSLPTTLLHEPAQKLLLRYLLIPIGIQLLHNLRNLGQSRPSLSLPQQLPQLLHINIPRPILIEKLKSLNERPLMKQLLPVAAGRDKLGEVDLARVVGVDLVDDLLNEAVVDGAVDVAVGLDELVALDYTGVVLVQLLEGFGEG